MKRVKFYSNTDLSLGINIKIALDFMKKINDRNYCINDILEMYNIIKLFNPCVIPIIKEEDRNLFYLNKNKLWTFINDFCDEINSENVEILIQEIEIYYESDFFELIEKYEIYPKITPTIFANICNYKQTFLHYILLNKKLVVYYDKYIRDILVSSSQAGEIIINKYEIKNHSEKIFLPNSLTMDDKEMIIQKYIESSTSNLNYLIIITNLKNTKELAIGDKTRLSAKKKVNKLKNNILSENSIKMGISIKFSKNLDKLYRFKKENLDWIFIYNLDWIEENKNFETLLIYNFIHMFEYVDFQMRWTMVSKPHTSTFVESYSIKSKKDYNSNLVFGRFNQLAIFQMALYYNELQKQDIRIEDMINWFFSEYIFKEFGIKNFNINMPSKSSSYLEKCRMLLPEIDSCLKQYNCYIEDRCINLELVEIGSTNLAFKDVKTLLKKKYIYPIEKEFTLISNYFFSNQSELTHVEIETKSSKNFYELIIHNNIKKTDYPEYAQMVINELITYKYIFINNNGYIKFTNIDKIEILKDLYNNEVISYWHLDDKKRKATDELIEKGILICKSSLFSLPEQNYLNYYLNKREFTNSLDLRNMYIHGTQHHNDGKNDYIIYLEFLRLFILILLKINDDLCLYSSNAYKITSSQN